MDIAAFVPRYFGIRRGAILVCIVGTIIQPWRFLSQAQAFLSVLNSFGVFIAPMTGVLCADYWVVRRQRLIVPDLYKPGGVYWFTAGVNWRAIVAFCLAFWPSMPGFIAAENVLMEEEEEVLEGTEVAPQVSDEEGVKEKEAKGIV
ncbi:hypothetical protein OQA88_6066 [Cercophora sp. LCS_1]